MSEARDVTWGFQTSPEALNSERSQCYVLLILFLAFGDNKAREYFISFFIFGLSAVFKVSHQTCPIVEINKVIR